MCRKIAAKLITFYQRLVIHKIKIMLESGRDSNPRTQLFEKETFIFLITILLDQSVIFQKTYMPLHHLTLLAKDTIYYVYCKDFMIRNPKSFLPDMQSNEVPINTI